MFLPLEYVRRMEKFFNFNVTPWYDERPYRGIRINLLKADERLLDLLPFETRRSPFADNGYYIDGDVSGIGTNPFHHAGAYYAQEPSASCAVNALDVRPGDRVLDLCAAPGGKSGQIAERQNGEGLLVANEYVKGRVGALRSNIERLGVRNAVITNCDSGVLCEELAGYFDKVLVDAPCSGEGMMRKEPAALENWSVDNIKMCAERQYQILLNAAKAVRPGGTLVYSTCTFAPEENEMVVERFLQSGGFEPVDCAFDFGRRGSDGISARIFPPDGGEGHFVARMVKTDGAAEDCGEYKISAEKDIVSRAAELYESLTDEPLYGDIAVFGDTIRILPVGMSQMRGVNVIAAGVELGKIKNKRIEPAHGFFMAAKRLRDVLDMDGFDERVAKFLNGQQIPCDGGKGYCGVAVNGYVMGFGKRSDGQLKNHYPKGLRNFSL